MAFSCGNSDDEGIVSSGSSFVNNPEMVKVVVGVNKVHFKVHRFLLAETSGWFQNNLPEQRGGETVLLDSTQMRSDDPDLFSFVVEWLYEYKDKPFTPVLWDENHPSVVTYWKLWYYAQELEMGGLQDYILRQFHAWSMEAPSELFSELAEEVITTGVYKHEDDKEDECSKLADWVIDFCVYHDGFFDRLTWDDCHEETFPARFMFEALKRYAKGRSTACNPSDTALKVWKKGDPSKEVSDYLVEG